MSALLLGVAVALPTVAAAQPTPGAPTDAESWTATVLLPVPGRAAPSPRARRVAQIMHFTAFSRRQNTLMVTGAKYAPNGRLRWVRVQLPKRPNGSSAWLPASSVRLNRLTTSLRVRLGARTVEVVKNGRVVKRYKAAVGTGSTPTPRGLFAVQDPVVSSASQRSYLGPYIITLTAFSPVLRTFMGGNGLVAIHGTSAPQLLGQAVSHGCVRVANDTATRIWRVAKPGMPVRIM
ncbi:MAG: L,D-transpeptidase [Actinobacteria bacterium]|nr:L,D-transpeptidase [Actinomycetota bacterium]